MNTPTYYEQERKIHEAYISNRIKPYSGEFCFCGTISEGTGADWQSSLYTATDFSAMEYALLSTIKDQTLGGNDMYFNSMALRTPGNVRVGVISHPNYEDALFNGMVEALKVLKEVHESKGEIIDIEPVFVKRQLSVI